MLFPAPCTPLNTVLRKALVVAVAVLFSDTDGGLQIFYGIGVVVSGSALITASAPAHACGLHPDAHIVHRGVVGVVMTVYIPSAAADGAALLIHDTEQA